MIEINNEGTYPCVEQLIENRVASRVHAKDATLYNFSPEAEECSAEFMGWTDLSSNPPTPISEIEKFAEEIRGSKIKHVVLLGQGGSTQAPMTLTKYNKMRGNKLDFRILDSDSPVRTRQIFATCPPEETLFIFSSKSGGTIEPRSQLAAIKDHYVPLLGKKMSHHLVAITDPGSPLENIAKTESWRHIFSGVPEVGGRFSAMSVFGLVPAALAGIDIRALVDAGAKTEKICSEDSTENPAIQLAAFLFDGFENGRDKFSFITPARGRVLGLWIEQLVAESLGKIGKGILPQVEANPLLLTRDPKDRSVVICKTALASKDAERDFDLAASYISPEIPTANCKVGTTEDLASQFVMWEYAVAMCGYLMQVSPFDQPDVASTKAAVLDILRDGIPDPNFVEEFTPRVPMGKVEVRQADCFSNCTTLRQTLHALFTSLEKGDYFALNAFVPFCGEGRREALSRIRLAVGRKLGNMSCIEVGPRYLHSTGQLQKGGVNDGVFLLISGNELDDIELPAMCEASSLGELAKAQAVGDMLTLASRGRRAVHLHLPDNSGITLQNLANIICNIMDDIA